VKKSFTKTIMIGTLLTGMVAIAALVPLTAADFSFGNSATHTSMAKDSTMPDTEPDPAPVPGPDDTDDGTGGGGNDDGPDSTGGGDF